MLEVSNPSLPYCNIIRWKRNQSHRYRQILLKRKESKMNLIELKHPYMVEEIKV